jgi:hypothetical protein
VSSRGVAAQIDCTNYGMTVLAGSSVGGIVLHLLAMVGDRCVRFHAAGIARELFASGSTAVLSVRIRACLIERLVRYVRQPSKHAITATRPDTQSLAAILDRGDILLSEGSTRAAALIKRITRSHWSHVSMYVGALDDGTDPRCIVEADIAEGVRSIRLSEVDALRVRVLRPTHLNNTERSRVAEWVIGRIGSEYDLPYAWALAQDLLHLRRWKRLRCSSPMDDNSTTRFICCTLLAHAFAVIGYPVVPRAMPVSAAATGDYRSLIPGDFEHATIFEVFQPQSRG